MKTEQTRGGWNTGNRGVTLKGLDRRIHARGWSYVEGWKYGSDDVIDVSGVTEYGV